MVFVDNYVRHSTDMLDSVCLPRHPRSAFPPYPSITLPAVRQELTLVTAQQLAEKNHQHLTKAVNKSMQAAAYGGSSLKGSNLWAISSPYLSMPYTLPLLPALDMFH